MNFSSLLFFFLLIHHFHSMNIEIVFFHFFWLFSHIIWFFHLFNDSFEWHRNGYVFFSTVLVFFFHLISTSGLRFGYQRSTDISKNQQYSNSYSMVFNSPDYLTTQSSTLSHKKKFVIFSDTKISISAKLSDYIKDENFFHSIINANNSTYTI